MDVRIERSADAEAIARLNEHVHQPHHLRQPGIFRPYSYEEALAVARELLARENARGLIAYRGEEPVGYAIALRRDYPSGLFREGHRALFIDQMAVKAGFQGWGIGEKLIEAVADLARVDGIARLELNVWTDNQGAVRFYQRCGFKPYTQNMYRDL